MNCKTFVGIYLLIAILLFCLVPVFIFYSYIDNDLVRTLFYVGASGGIGGTVYSIRGFYQNTGGETFKPNWVWWYIFRPIISVVSGVFVYFLIVGGLMSISNNTDVTFSKGVMFYCAIAFLAGFSFTRFMGKVESISENVFSESEHVNPSAKDNKDTTQNNRNDIENPGT